MNVPSTTTKTVKLAQPKGLFISFLLNYGKGFPFMECVHF